MKIEINVLNIRNFIKSIRESSDNSFARIGEILYCWIIFRIVQKNGAKRTPFHHPQRMAEIWTSFVSFRWKPVPWKGSTWSMQVPVPEKLIRLRGSISGLSSSRGFPSKKSWSLPLRKLPHRSLKTAFSRGSGRAGESSPANRTITDHWMNHCCNLYAHATLNNPQTVFIR